MKLSHIKELDGVRGLSALLVMICHIHINLKSTIPFLIERSSIFGHLGVSLFFTLSGFLITRILISVKHESQYFRNFFIKRSLRIFPLYYLYLSLYYFVFPLFALTTSVPFSQQAFYWFYLQDFAITFKWKTDGPSIFWSLAIEEHFYLFWPFIVKRFSKERLVNVLLLIIFLSLATRALLVHYGYEVYYFTFARMDELSLGAILAIWNFGNPNRKKGVLSLIVFVCMSLSIIPIYTVWSGNANPFIQIVKYQMMAVACASAIGLVVSLPEFNWIKSTFRFQPLRFIGKISYGLYVYHPMVFFLYHEYLTSGIVLVDIVGSFVAAVLIATISYEYFEKIFLRFKDRFTTALPSKDQNFVTL